MPKTKRLKDSVHFLTKYKINIVCIFFIVYTERTKVLESDKYVANLNKKYLA
jgi:hypothetical protein